MTQQWTKQAFEARIRNSKTRKRFPAGSPDVQEIRAYKDYISNHYKGNLKDKKALVLGLTPELRSMLHHLGVSVICIDNNPNAIALFQDWVPENLDIQEEIIDGNWADLSNLISSPVDIVVGDGIFGNLLSLKGHLDLLKQIKSVISPTGICVFRKILIPREFSQKEYEANLLISKYETGLIDSAEFGFGMRIFGLMSQVFDDQSFLLDNKQSFAMFEQMYRDKKLTDSAISAIQRYYFDGFNLITPQDVWEKLLKTMDFDFDNTPLSGKQWYDYYCVYCCSPRVV